jgi:hypothetical protein
MSEAFLWQPLSINELKRTFAPAQKPYWISGGWAIDLFLKKQTRPHDDLDITIAREDQTCFQQFLKTWDLRVSDPPGSGVLRPWLEQEVLSAPAYNIWGRQKTDGP